MADWGAIAAYGPSAYQAGGMVAFYIEKILKGAAPGDLPIVPVDPTFIVNQRTAQCLGIQLPLGIMRYADRVVR
jgi:putative ABC transport system substrate-binding protein